ncbi:MAG TPA: cupin domain-containing protein [Polyangia bacterium]|nr:cupin domain-containing protein [Polyangia bacterium]
MNETRVVLQDLLARAKNPDFPWTPLRSGIDVHKIYDSGEDGPSAALLRYAPGATLPHHAHPGYEHITILEGSQVDQHGTYRAPCFIVNPPGSSHGVTSPDGCLVLVVWQQPVVFSKT